MSLVTARNTPGLLVPFLGSTARTESTSLGTGIQFWKTPGRGSASLVSVSQLNYAGSSLTHWATLELSAVVHVTFRLGCEADGRQ